MLRDSTPRFVSPSVGPLVGLSVGLSIGPFVGPSVGPLVRLSHFTFSALMGVLALLLLPKCSTALNMAPAHPHATRLAVYPALFFVYSKHKP